MNEVEKEVATLTEKAKAYSALRVPLTRLKQTTEDAKTLSAQSNVATTAVSTALSRHPYSFELAPSIVLKTTTERSDD